jgi:Ribonuclease G/E
VKGLQIHLGSHRGRSAAALMRDGRLDDLLIDADDDVPVPGTVFRAICDRAVKGQGGMFLKLGDGLTAWHRGAKGLTPGQAVLVQVTGHAEPGKAVPVTDRLLFKSRYAIVTPGAPGINAARSLADDEADRLREIAHDVLPEARGDLGCILRSAGAGVDSEVVAGDLLATCEAARAVLADPGTAPERLLDGPDAQALAWREWPEAPVTEAWDDVAEAIEMLRAPVVALGGVRVFVEPTRALVAVDVNTPEGGAGGLKANLAAAGELPRQLRLRGLAGQIVVDFAPMAKKDRRAVESAVRRAFRSDPVETSVIGWTPLGHLELTRRRERRPLADLL